MLKVDIHRKIWKWKLNLTWGVGEKNKSFLLEVVEHQIVFWKFHLSDFVFWATALVFWAFGWIHCFCPILWVVLLPSNKSPPGVLHLFTCLVGDPELNLNLPLLQEREKSPKLRLLSLLCRGVQPFTADAAFRKKTHVWNGDFLQAFVDLHWTCWLPFLGNNISMTWSLILVN